MKVIIPVAGAGTRLRPHTHSTPKVLISVAGKPMIGHILDQLVGLPIDQIVMVVGQMGDKIKEYVDGHYKFKVKYIVQEEAKGLADAIYLTRDVVKKDDALIILGDTIFSTDFKKLLSKKSSQIGVKEVSDPRRFGVVEHLQGKITRLVEKPEHPQSNLAIVGIYLMKDMPKLYSAIGTLIDKKIKTKGEYQLTDALQVLIDRGQTMETFTVDGWYDCGKPETLLDTNRQLLDLHSRKSGKKKIKGVVINNPVSIDPSARIEKSVIGPYVSVAAGSHVKNAIISDTIIGKNAYLESIMLQKSIIGDNAVVKGKQRKLSVGDGSEVDLS
ncbi:MAG: NTP transferase domain-containing protein [Candidatus Edwardsbacteria bacterium]|nr:NTP transferase domain-containing protein [Candidatus Edwardsbacteria bacterium]MBU1576523.1 NTP transferase domain-containing protein [Candidatus Edwardsbacteria bacterium]MBU2464074.1 NTP transferase domain-containing protein [Candidatus Edwardsbacteria bacterium]MBU2593868.1 NTP transferase domain-containing protein [Candidatus Edwardsbacteria bacterium]